MTARRSSPRAERYAALLLSHTESRIRTLLLENRHLLRVPITPRLLQQSLGETEASLPSPLVLKALGRLLDEGFSPLTEGPATLASPPPAPSRSAQRIPT